MSWSLYKTDTGHEIVREELDELDVDVRASMVELITRADRGDARPREAEKIEGDIRCLRLSLGHNEYRLLYSLEGHGGHILLGLVVHTKKKEKLPRRVIEKAGTRLKDHRARGAAKARDPGSERSGQSGGRQQSGKKNPRGR